MEHLNKCKHLHEKFGFIILIILILSALYQAYLLININNKLSILRNNVASTTNSLTLLNNETNTRFSNTEQRSVELSDMLYEEQKRSDELDDSLRFFDRQVDKLSDNVDTLEKLTTTDPELLQKYSKIYFLNEHYKPADLSAIDEEFDFVNGKEASIHAEVWPFLEDLLEKAKDDDITLLVLSGYRSYEEQSTLKEQYTVQYGVGANKFSADQGYSEHQLGTAVDFTTDIVGQDLSRFEGSEAHSWLLRYAYKYGFVMSYPENNDYYEYEPWHWRFVGEDLARYLRNKNKYFYDLEQRKIDEYIPVLFDN